MSLPNHPRSDFQDPDQNDPVWDLLDRDAATHPVKTSPWFATRTAALVEPREKFRFRLLRWLLPLPLTAVAAMVFVTLQPVHHAPSSGSLTSEERFEHNMDMLFASME